MWLFSAVVLLVLTIFSFLSWDSKKWGWILAVIAAATFAYLFYVTRQQFFLWHGNEISKFFVPPYAGMGYFLFYSFSRFWAPYLASWAVGLLAFWAVRFLNKKQGNRFLHDEEPYFIWLGFFLSGHPGWVLYIVLILLSAVLLSFVLTNYKPQTTSYRLSLYYIWLPTAIVAILLNQWLLVNWSAYSSLLL